MDGSGERSQEVDCEVTSEKNRSVKSSQKKHGQVTEQPEDTDTEVHNQQKESETDTAGVSGQSADQEDNDTSDGKCVKGMNENKEVPQAGESLRKKSSNKNQKIEHKGEGDHVETLGIPDAANIFRQVTEPPEDTDTEVHNQHKESETDTAGVSGQSDDQEDNDTSDGKCHHHHIKGVNENKEVPQAGESLRKRRSNKNQKIEHKGEGDHVETLGIPAANTFRDTNQHGDDDQPDLTKKSKKGLFVLPALLLSLIAFSAVVWWTWQPSPPSLQKDLNFLEVFHQEMDKVQASFPSQHRELWRRCKIHLRKHLNLTYPTEPVSLILTSGRVAEKTLGCLAQQLAAAFSKARNSSVLGIDGTSKSAQDSDQVKLDIDKVLKEAFEGGTQAAVIHRFEELPPGSTLIFYRYCDHENAAFKKVFLAFTVMLQKEMNFQPNVSLGWVEEQVQDYLKEKFLFSDRIAKFDQMDLDKLGGLWSRISHLILPVTAEPKIEQHGCQT